MTVFVKISWLLFCISAVFANLPFIFKRLFGIWYVYPQKNFTWRLLELALYYCLVGILAIVLESRVAILTHQGWRFYAITIAVFLMLSFPGFTWRYLIRH